MDRGIENVEGCITSRDIDHTKERNLEREESQKDRFDHKRVGTVKYIELYK